MKMLCRNLMPKVIIIEGGENMAEDHIVATEALHRLFDANFMKKYTKDVSVYDFFSNADVKLPDKQTMSTSDIQKLNKYTTCTTNFKNWDDMFNQARKEMNDLRPVSSLKLS